LDILGISWSFWRFWRYLCYYRV